MPHTEHTAHGHPDQEPPQRNLSGTELLEAARRIVRQRRAARGLPAWSSGGADDIVSDVVEACLIAQEHGTVVTERYVYGVASNLVHRDRSMNSADARALRLLHEHTARLEQEQGHVASPAQVEQLAARIIDEWDRPARRPTRGFHLRPVTLSLDATPGFRALADVLPAPEGDDEEDDEPLDALNDLADLARVAHDKAEHSAVRRACWNTLAAVHGAPAVSGPIGKNRVTQARTVILRHPDGANSAMGLALTDAGRGHATQLSAALFTPFERADDSGRGQVVNLLRRYRPHAVELWSAALSASSSAFYVAAGTR